MMPQAALIFDCDGVLVDSEALSVAELGRALRDAGAKISDDQIFDRMIGRSVKQISAIILEEQGLDMTSALSQYRESLRHRFDAELQPIQGIGDAIRAMADLPRIVASSSGPERIAQSLALTGLADLFGDRICSAVEVTHGKPAPDLFLLAAARLGVDPAQCIVIEDSEAGVRAAKSAGMRVVGFMGGSHAAASALAVKLPALGVDALARHANDLPSIIAGLTGSGSEHVSGN